MSSDIIIISHPKNAGVFLFQAQKMLASFRILSEHGVTVLVNTQIERFCDIGDVGVDVGVGVVIIDGEAKRIGVCKNTA